LPLILPLASYGSHVAISPHIATLPPITPLAAARLFSQELKVINYCQ
jgi:hypothetical protein